MKKILKMIYKKYKNIRNIFIWNKEFKRISKEIESNNIEELYLDGKKMILIPHSDDEWIGCSQVIKKSNEDNLIFCNMNMQGGDSEQLHKVRYEELEKTAKKFGAKLCTLSNNKVDELKTIIIKEKPKFIFVPFFIDWHPEHIETINILYNAIQMTNYEGNIIAYQVSLPMLSNMINKTLPMNKEEFKYKWKYFKDIYKTQTTIPYERFKYNERINGKLVNTYACEPYLVCSIEEWISYYKKWKINEKDREYIIDNLNSIGIIRKKLRDIYESSKER